jgi:hypothetical protein
MADAGHTLSIQDGVDQARLPDVRAADYRKLRTLVTGEIAGLVRRPMKTHRFDFQVKVLGLV